MRRCTVCLERFELSAAHFGLTKRGFAYVCVECKSIDNAIRYRRKKLETPTEVVPFAEQERRIILRALASARGSVDKAAKLLQIGRATLYRKLDAYRAEGTFEVIDFEALRIIRKELAELEAKWENLRRRARIIRRREARKAEFSRRLDQAITEVQRERTERETALERRNRDAVREAQGREAERRARKLSAVAVRADVDQGLAGPACLPQESRGSVDAGEALVERA
jgi:transposase